MLRLIGAVLALGACLLASLAYAEQPYPSRPVKLILPGPPGGPLDIRGRWLAEKLTPSLGQPVMVDYRPGAGGNVGAEAAAKSAADGHTLLIAHQGILAVNPHLYERTGFNPLTDFAPITRLVDTSLLLMVPSASPIHSLTELVRLARTKPNELFYGSSGVGNPPHLAVELFRLMAGIEVIHVPYKGAAAAAADLVAGRLMFAIDSPASHGPHLKTGRLRALAVTGRERLAQFPDLPTMAEAGLTGYEYGAWMGVLAPAGTSDEVVGRLNAEIVKALRMSEARDWFAAQGAVPAPEAPEQFAAFIRAEHEKWGRIIRETGIRAQ